MTNTEGRTGKDYEKEHFDYDEKVRVMGAERARMDARVFTLHSGVTHRVLSVHSTFEGAQRAIKAGESVFIEVHEIQD